MKAKAALYINAHAFDIGIQVVELEFARSRFVWEILSRTCFGIGPRDLPRLAADILARLSALTE
jgi:hypothetical protein